MTFPTTMLPGVAYTVTLTSTTTAKFKLTGLSSGHDYNVYFSLPAGMVLSGTTIPVTYTASYNTSNTDTQAATSFDPYAGVVYTATTATYYVRVGGTANPGSNIPAGNYSGTIIIYVLKLN